MKSMHRESARLCVVDDPEGCEAIPLGDAFGNRYAQHDICRHSTLNALLRQPLGIAT